MSRCQLSVAVNGDMQQFLLQAEILLKAAGGSIEGDQNDGTILVDTPVGTLFGIYTTTEDAIHINITRKPLLLSCTNIKSLVADALGIPAADLL